ncbi:MAG: hypothetical protein A2W28_08685 [Gammaproteobacteria bacterium RBG_16_51_14]|nr:MAG: hypothetical protein A2W28_08685 [Gammaproteobacteria bacterium RBG_16_51_14]
MNSVNDPDQSKPNLQQVELSEGIFLVANRNLADPNFSQTVILLTEYSNTGTCGLIINRRADLLVTDLFPKQDNMNSLTDKVRMGGPVALNRVQILFQAKNTPVGARHIVENIFLVNSIPLLNQISRGDFLPEALNVYAGYAGWATGQLETELLRGDWYLWQADAATVFKKPAQEIWPDLIRLVTTQWVDNQSDKRPLFSHTSLYY